MPSKVVNRVHFFARANKQGLSFGNCNGVPDDEDPFDSNGDSYNSDDDSDDGVDNGSVDYDSDDNDDAVNNNATIPTAGVNDADNNAADDNNNNSLSDSSDSSSLDSSDKENKNSNEGKDTLDNNDDNDSNDSEDNAGTNDAEDDNDDKYKDENEPTADAQMSMEQAMDTQYGKRGTNHDLRPRRPCNYGHIHATLEGIMMSQYNMEKGIKLFGQDGVNDVLSKLSQLHNRSVLDPKDAKTLSREEKKAALEYLMFLKKKRCRKIKGRGCADGRFTNRVD
jgi:hypothetical protein